MKFFRVFFSSGLVHRMVFVCFLVLSCQVWVGRAKAEEKVKVEGLVQEFSADVVRKDAKGGQGVSRGKMYVGRHGVRTEGERMGQPVWMIFRPQEKRVWTLFPQEKGYTQTEGKDIGRPPMPDEPESPCRKDKQFICRDMGPQVMAGRETRVWDIAMNLPQGGVQAYARMWVDVSLKIAIRELYADGLEVTLENVRQEVQSATLFEVPEGFRQISTPVAGEGVEKR
ncbi:MAG: hypothetical protein HW380_792 [Magnetococcales bacterium]|nr:hypothetical protein [Magnetococcales bacterium]HIJ85647.1 hypothetical protein [Magnetococcales bacterium]